MTKRSKVLLLRLEIALALLCVGQGCCAAQDSWKNSYPANVGYGAANAGGTGKLPSGPPSRPAKDEARRNDALNSYDRNLGFGAANAGGTGKLPRAPSSRKDAGAGSRHRGRVAHAAQRGSSTGIDAGAISGNVGTGGTDGAGSR